MYQTWKDWVRLVLGSDLEPKNGGPPVSEFNLESLSSTTEFTLERKNGVPLVSESELGGKDWGQPVSESDLEPRNEGRPVPELRLKRKNGEPSASEYEAGRKDWGQPVSESELERVKRSYSSQPVERSFWVAPEDIKVRSHVALRSKATNASSEQTRGMAYCGFFYACAFETLCGANN
jgi:hypothetical protein